MITGRGYYKCDYCGGEGGEFYTATGNHSTCQELASLEARAGMTAELLRFVEDTIGTDNRFMQDWLRRYEDAKRLAERQEVKA